MHNHQCFNESVRCRRGPPAQSAERRARDKVDGRVGENVAAVADRLDILGVGWLGRSIGDDPLRLGVVQSALERGAKERVELMLSASRVG